MVYFSGQNIIKTKFQEFESSKKRPNLDQKTLPKSNNHEKNQQKRRKEKRRQPSKYGFEFNLKILLTTISYEILYNFTISNFEYK